MSHSMKLLSRAAVVDGATGKARILERSEAHRLDKARLVDTLGEMGIAPKRGQAGLASHVTLTPSVPWVDGKGFLSMHRAADVYADDPLWGGSSGGVNFHGEKQAELRIHLLGLQPDSSYVARIEVGNAVPAAYWLSAGGTAQTITTSPGSHTLLLSFPSSPAGLSVMLVRCEDWHFHEAEVLRLEI